MTDDGEDRPLYGDRSAEYLRVLSENERYTDAFDRSRLTASPLSGLAIVACMDSRLDIEETLGLRTGDAHIIRNAGGIVTDDVIRSLIVSQHVLATDEVIVIMHTRCGLLDLDEDALRERLSATSGVPRDIRLGSFLDLESTVRASLERLRSDPWLRPGPVHGLIFDVSTGRLHEVTEG